MSAGTPSLADAKFLIDSLPGGQPHEERVREWLNEAVREDGADADSEVIAVVAYAMSVIWGTPSSILANLAAVVDD